MAGQNMRDAWKGKIASLCLALLVAVGLFTPGWAAVPNPQDQVRGFYGVLLGTMRDGRTLGESGRYARLAPAVDRTFDIPTMTRLAIGPAWGPLSPAQQQQLLAAFAHSIAATYADRFDSYSGEQSNGEATRLDYLMRQDQGSWRISDVYLDGTISQLAVHRSEFHSILQREGVDGLVMALNRKTDLLQSVARSS
jgi:phospholipid transport system substrate-binding protein